MWKAFSTRALQVVVYVRVNKVRGKCPWVGSSKGLSAQRTQEISERLKWDLPDVVNIGLQNLHRQGVL